MGVATFVVIVAVAVGLGVGLAGMFCFTYFHFFSIDSISSKYGTERYQCMNLEFNYEVYLYS